ncbi:uracil-DNA glycosylase [Thermaerobacter subterraneus]|uniref:Type-4 uracil-DNA glycosylase n=1 Tax=Thermaerobacter subterraneus DSM 13965 TaxID=867903 RepID=K6QD65_9FIRM|nr:uracil-DNA glycosylase [Thermaerobacter subterraneus]EKP94566.1 uracil-DNA glycosylase, family 4 [Thermaerobacter subterraneus DSM 13965]
MARPEAELMRIHDMATLEQVVKGCTACGLRAGCRGVVFGDGNPSARLMLIGEGPGADEDRLGRPFVGRAGQLLDRILAACGFDRQRHVYIANIVKCRPPGNRTPTPEERAACLPNLRAQMWLVQPVIVVLLGSTALQALVDPAARISRARGQWIVRDGVWYMPTYHPAALLRNPALKRECWHDFKKVIDKYRELVDPAHVAPHYPPGAEGPAPAADRRRVPAGEEPWAAGSAAAAGSAGGPVAGAAGAAAEEAAATREPEGGTPPAGSRDRVPPGDSVPSGNGVPPGDGVHQLNLFDQAGGEGGSRR